MQLWSSKDWEQEQSLQRKPGRNRSETGQLLAPCMTPGQSWMSSGQWLITATHRLCWTAKSWTPKKEATLSIIWSQITLVLQPGTEPVLGKGSVSSLRKFISTSTAFLQKRIPQEMPEDESACIPAGTPKHHHHHQACLAWWQTWK